MPKSSPKSSDDASEPKIESLDFESAASLLETIIDDLEQGDVPLERSLEAYDRGQRLVARCREILDQAAERMREVELEPIEEEGDP